MQTRVRTIQEQTETRVRIFLLIVDGHSIDDIADKVGSNCKSVMLCISKFCEGGIDNALFLAIVGMRKSSMMRKPGLLILPVRHIRPSTIQKSTIHTDRVKSKEELAECIYMYFDEVNEEPVVFHGQYNLDGIDVSEEGFADILL